MQQIENNQQAQQSPAVEQIELKPRVNPELVKKYRQIFDSYDKEQDGYVQAKDVPGVMKILGVTVSQQQVIEMLGTKIIKSENPLISSKIDFMDFLSLIVDKENEIAMKEQLMQSFKIFDTQKNGMIPLTQMRYYLRTYGIPMSQEEVQDLLKDSDPQDGLIKYEDFINRMLGINQ